MPASCVCLLGCCCWLLHGGSRRPARAPALTLSPPLFCPPSLLPFNTAPQLYGHIILMAYGMVLINAAVLTPFILYVLGFSGRGWNWIQVPGAVEASCVLHALASAPAHTSLCDRCCGAINPKPLPLRRLLPRCRLPRPSPHNRARCWPRCWRPRTPWR